MTSPRTRTRRLFASAAAFALAVTGVAIAAPSAEATPIQRTFTAGFLEPSTTIAHGVINDYALVVKNTSMAVSAMDRIRVTIPEGFDVIPGSVSAPRGGWAESVSGSTLTAKTTKPLRSGLRKTETLTVNFTATSVGCAEKVAAQWQVRADGLLLNFSNTGAVPTVSVSAVEGPCAVSAGGAGNPVTLDIPDAAAADLPNGANGAVSLSVQQCTSEEFCDNGTEIALTGDFKGLYTNEAPAGLSRTCAIELCPHLSGDGEGEGEGGDAYTYNYYCPEEHPCALYGNYPFDEREVEEDFINYPTYVSLREADGTYADFLLAGRCVDLPTEADSGEAMTEKLTMTGVIQSPAAQAAGFCVDVNAITRGFAPGTEIQSFDGDLTIPVLFVEDPRLRP